MSPKKPKVSLARVDLNLLVILDLLLKERHVSRVAEKMFVSQSAISRSLKKLRELFEDPLFTRTAKGLVPTHTALQLQKELDGVLPLLSGILNRSAFDEKTCDDTFRISVSPFIGAVLIPQLFMRLQEQAPRVGLIEETIKSNTLQLLDNNQVDFAFHYEDLKSPKYCSFYIGDIYPVLYVRAEHPLLPERNPTLNQILEYPVIGNLVEDEAHQSIRMPINAVLQDLVHKHQKPSLRTAQAGSLLKILKESDSVLFGSNGLEALPGFGEEFVQVYSLQDTKKYRLPIYLLYHVRNENSDAHQWLAGIIKGLSGKIIGKS